MSTALEGTPESLGFVRKPDRDHLKGPEVWRTPEGVLLRLPPGCRFVRLQAVRTARGEALACVEPAGVTSIWPFKRGKQTDE